MIHPIDQIAASNSTAMQALSLEPVLCIDCETYVPLGWVEYGTVKCPENIGGNGVQYGHRVRTETLTNIKDTLANRYAPDPAKEENA